MFIPRIIIRISILRVFTSSFWPLERPFSFHVYLVASTESRLASIAGETIC